MSGALAEHGDSVRRLVQTNPAPRVRRGAPAQFLVAQGESVGRAATRLGTAAHRVRAWRERYLERGQDGLVDSRRAGRPPTLGPADLALLDEALTQGAQAYGWPVTGWSIRDLCE